MKVTGAVNYRIEELLRDLDDADRLDRNGVSKTPRDNETSQDLSTLNLVLSRELARHHKERKIEHVQPKAEVVERGAKLERWQSKMEEVRKTRSTTPDTIFKFQEVSTHSLQHNKYSDLE